MLVLSTSCLIYETIFKMFATVLIVFAVGLLFISVLKRNASKYKNYPPGPVNLPVIGGAYALGVEPHKNLVELKRKYGNVIALNFGSYRGIVLNDLETIKRAFSLPELQSRPKFEATRSCRGEERSGIIWSTGKTNEEQRAFISKTLKSFGVGTKRIETLLQEQLQILWEGLDKQDGKVIINHDLFNTTAMGALWTIISGESGREEDESFQDILRTTRRVAAALKPAVYFFPSLSQFFPNASGWNNMVESVHQQNVFVNKTVESHKQFLKAENEEPSDIIEAFLKKVGTTDDTTSTFYGVNGGRNIIGTIGDLILGGTETVSTSLTWLLAILIRHPDIQNKMQAEIDKVIGPDRLPTLTDRQILPYTEAVIFEILRYTGIVPMAAPHETSDEVEIEGYLIPKHTIVIPNLYDIMHDPKLWDEPEEFKPERFLNKDGSELLRNMTKNVDMIFGYGKRHCPGRTLTKDELFLFTTGLCQRYTFIKDPNSHYEDEIKVKCAATIVPTPHNLIICKR